MEGCFCNRSQLAADLPSSPKDQGKFKHLVVYQTVATPQENINASKHDIHTRAVKIPYRHPLISNIRRIPQLVPEHQRLDCEKLAVTSSPLWYPP